MKHAVLLFLLFLVAALAGCASADGWSCGIQKCECDKVVFDIVDSNPWPCGPANAGDCAVTFDCRGDRTCSTPDGRTVLIGQTTIEVIDGACRDVHAIKRR